MATARQDMDSPIARSIQEFVPGKQVTLAHLIAHPTDDLSKKIGVPGADAIGIMTLTPGETSMIAADIATKAADGMAQAPHHLEQWLPAGLFD